MTLSADDLLYGYVNGIFPMADPSGELYWYAPDPRAIIPIDTYRPAKSLRPILAKNLVEIRINTAFREVMEACALPRGDDPETWISEEIINAYTDLHERGFAHSVEAFRENKLVGGLYGVAIGSVFFGESMFYFEPNASKIAFHYLIERLRKLDYQLLDTQFMNDNVLRYGAIEIPKVQYMQLLKMALRINNSFA